MNKWLMIQTTCFIAVCENLVNRLRRKFFKAILHQDIAWFDTNNSGELATKLFDNLERFKEGTGDKIGLTIQYIAQSLGGFAIAFVFSWKLTLIMMSLTPFMIVCGSFMAKRAALVTKEEAKKYAEAGKIAEEALTSMKTVIAFNGQQYECERWGIVPFLCFSQELLNLVNNKEERKYCCCKLTWIVWSRLRVFA
ncbi:unnamed protein product [Nippostrongylus brasiliensis]|uniref:ABC transmembrane type-1 domain-containing protein n=1 Tax=Nippostrongylus brasiliensis TaxID=27835 RepID=A0A0N4XMJ2_NIPBR|nr:unnamed protein product [Nippostrongylus brasiliensis]